jgi:hypothetical protein
MAAYHPANGEVYRRGLQTNAGAGQHIDYKMFKLFRQAPRAMR